MDKDKRTMAPHLRLHREVGLDVAAHRRQKHVRERLCHFLQNRPTAKTGKHINKLLVHRVRGGDATGESNNQPVHDGSQSPKQPTLPMSLDELDALGNSNRCDRQETSHQMRLDGSRPASKRQQQSRG
jgi:hypothetical protein